MILMQFRPIQEFINQLNKIENHPYVDCEHMKVNNYARYDGEYVRVTAEYEPLTNKFILSKTVKTKEEAVRLARAIDQFYKDYDKIIDERKKRGNLK